MKEWGTIGHVPFKEKDKLYKQYHSLVDQLFERFNISASNRKLSTLSQTSVTFRVEVHKLYTENVKSLFVLMRT